MRIPRKLADEMIAHAREDAPNECCGMLGGSDGEVRTLHRTRNGRPSPYSYDIDSKDLIKAYNLIMDEGNELVGIYHSHTGSPAYPSQTDVNLASYPDSLYLIVSLEHPDDPVLRGFWIREEKIDEQRLDIV